MNKFIKFGYRFDQKPVIQSNKSSTKRLRKNMVLIPDEYQHGAKLDAQTHQKSMPKQVTEKLGNIIQNHVFLMCRNIRIHSQNNIVWKNVQVACTNGKVIKHRQQLYPNLLKINVKSMLGFIIQKTYMLSKMALENGAKIRQKQFQFRCRNLM